MFFVNSNMIIFEILRLINRASYKTLHTYGTTSKFRESELKKHSYMTLNTLSTENNTAYKQSN